MSKGNDTIYKNFYHVRNNRFCLSVKEKTATSFEVVSKKDASKVFHEERFNTIGGSLRRIMIWDEPSTTDDKISYRMMAIDLKDEKGEYECIQMYFESNAAVSFLKRLPNIDLTRPISIKISKDEREGSDKIFDRLDVYQKTAEGESKLCPYFWNAENKLPKWEQVTVGKGASKKTIWDKSDQNELLEKLVHFKNAEIVDTIKAVQRDGIAPENLQKEKGEFGMVLTGVDPEKGKTASMPSTKKEEKQEATATSQTAGKSDLLTQEDDLPF